VICSSRVYGWFAPMESMDGLLQWRVLMVYSSGEFGLSAPIGEYDCPVESMDGLLQSSVRMVCTNGEYG
jgi:hypothetical protein